jgi:hypothetical protein
MKVRDKITETVKYLADTMLDDNEFSYLDTNQQQSYRDTVIQAYNLAFDVRVVLMFEKHAF